MKRKRFVLCGLSDRGISMFALPMLGPSEFLDAADDLSDLVELVAVLDIDQVRMDRFNERTGANLATYGPSGFDAMIADHRPDAVVVASPDATHAGYVVAALRHDLDVIVEKPLAAFAEQAQEILLAERASAGTVTVGHNVRYSTSLRRMRNLVAGGAIGRVVAVDLLWGVDTYHGASYFRRWNRERGNSGGLSVHKAVHHLDMVNWLIGAVPAEVYSAGARNFYGPQSPHRPRGPGGEQLPIDAERRLSPYHQRWQGDALPAAPDHFAGPWQAMGYPVQYPEGSDRYVFDDAIDIEDTYSTVVRFASGASMSYSLCFSFPWEGFRLGISGTHGRIESDQITFRGSDSPSTEVVKVLPLFGAPERIEVETQGGGHGGTDRRIRRDLLLGTSESSRRDGLDASSLQGAIAVATGEAMWRSQLEHRPISIADLLGLDELPQWDAQPDSVPFRSPADTDGAAGTARGR
ncbi:MAG TPA: Gfo/Idh/MocA family oxidoreductase [Actinopolymorphaceae bacterium]